MSINRGMDKENVTRMYQVVLFSHEEKNCHLQENE